MLQGWFQIGTSAECSEGQVITRRVFDSEIVLWRTADGTVTVTDAHCGHLGAHLGIGGRIKNDTLVCPYHGWAWDRTGLCARVPYAPNEVPDARIRAWPSVERSGGIFVWTGRADSVEECDIPDVHGGEATPSLIEMKASHGVGDSRAVVYRDRAIDPRVPGEHSTDFAHFKYIHLATDAAVQTNYSIAGNIFRADYAVDYKIGPGSPKPHRVRFTNFGPGVVTVENWGVVDHVLLASVTPTGGGRVDVYYSVWVTEELSARVKIDYDPIFTALIAQFEADLIVWENQTWVADPPYLASESRCLRDYRIWAEHFSATRPGADRTTI
ncbi:Rieske 2Fe-2S domain-containing protein [Antrihabitans cavernicola]|nr:Rieske 2Fe-2S domain-containing protein [Spelaeibacter cavernicola]